MLDCGNTAGELVLAMPVISAKASKSFEVMSRECRLSCQSLSVSSYVLQGALASCRASRQSLQADGSAPGGQPDYEGLNASKLAYGHPG